jgi:hypothetical protein
MRRRAADMMKTERTANWVTRGRMLNLCPKPLRHICTACSPASLPPHPLFFCLQHHPCHSNDMELPSTRSFRAAELSVIGPMSLSLASGNPGLWHQSLYLFLANPGYKKHQPHQVREIDRYNTEINFYQKNIKLSTLIRVQHRNS